MKHSGHKLLRVYTVGIVILFLTGFLMLVLFGAKSYQNTVGVQNANMDSRALSAYIASAVKGSDTAGAVRLETGEDGPVLVIADADTGYALRIYRHDGALLEDFAKDNSPLDAKHAQVIAKTSRFEAALSDGLLTVRTDEGRAVLRLRSEGGGGQ